jgi:hypothetical protein
LTTYALYNIQIRQKSKEEEERKKIEKENASDDMPRRRELVFFFFLTSGKKSIFFSLTFSHNFGTLLSRQPFAYDLFFLAWAMI